MAMKVVCSLSLTLILFLVGCSRAPQARAEPMSDVDVASNMALTQRWTDKLGRAGAVGNWELVDYYLHELEETAGEFVENDVFYKGRDIGQLTRTMLYPAIESLEDAAKTQEIEGFQLRYANLIATCNACHTVTGYSAIRITEPDLSINPWNQDFRPAN
jgi:hypothetical protein